ncbi:MAG: flagellar motor protein MotB [candidate division Zixibacteria bacterium]|nr:flagellar motor protein MotB [candidate division Zixibacteria bacterium]
MRRSRRTNKTDENDEHIERWLLTYADLITLLLAFFVVMYSMSQIDAKRFGEMSEALHGILKGGDGILREVDPDIATPGHGLLKLGNLRMLQENVEKKVSDSNKLEDVQMELTERGLVVHIVERALFAEGSADLQLGATGVLDLIYSEIADIPNHIRIEGHTDDRSITSSRYPSNWELSSDRATQVVRYFVEDHGCSPDRISALGYGKYRPIRPNNSIENRALNRRVDIVVLTMELSVKEPSSDMYNLASK